MYFAAKLTLNVATAEECVLSNLSYQLGYQLAGSSNNEEALFTSCEDTTSPSYDKWAKIGLNLTEVQAPLCNMSHTVPNTTYATVNSIYYNSKIFTTHLLNSFNSTAGFDTLCRHLNIGLLDSFPVNGQNVKTAACRAGVQAIAPEPESAPAIANQTAVKAAKNTASIIYAILVASAATTGSELNLYCAHAPDYVTSLNEIELNGSLVESILCKFTAPIAGPEAKSTLVTWMSRYYITVLENASKVEGWLDWLCQNVDVEKMNAAALDGDAVKYQICADAAGAGASKRGA